MNNIIETTSKHELITGALDCLDYKESQIKRLQDQRAFVILAAVIVVATQLFN